MSGPSVADRDRQILDAIVAAQDGLTIAEVADAASCGQREAYESLWRLRSDGKVHREGATRDARWVSGER
jgi:DNA-binding IclR family transcriptional regulator